MSEFRDLGKLGHQLSEWVTKALRLEVIYTRLRMGQKELHIFYSAKSGKVIGFKFIYGYPRMNPAIQIKRLSKGFYSPYILS